jgi:heat shock protein HtpX
LLQLATAAKLPSLPKVYIIPTPERNAFAAGIKPDDSVIAVTTGLMNTLDHKELKAVLGHEVGRI